MDAYTTINNTWEISWNTGYLLGNVHVGIWEFVGMRYHVNDVQMIQTIKSQLMTSQGSHTKRSHQSITQPNHTNQSHKTR